MTLEECDQYLRQVFDFVSFQDRSLNGIQVQSTAEIRNIAFAVDCTLSTLNHMEETNSDLLIVHHGLFWGTSQPITGPLYQKLQFLLSKNIALYAIHLPLDAHPILGHNAQWAKLLELKNSEQNLFYKGLPLGFTGSISKASLLEKLKIHFPSSFLEEKQSQIRSLSNETLQVGISSGAFSASLLAPILQSSHQKLDLILTGEVDLGTFNEAKDHHLLVIPLGHYYTETLGLQALMEFMKKTEPSLNFNFIGDDKFV